MNTTSPPNVTTSPSTTTRPAITLATNITTLPLITTAVNTTSLITTSADTTTPTITTLADTTTPTITTSADTTTPTITTSADTTTPTITTSADTTTPTITTSADTTTPTITTSADTTTPTTNTSADITTPTITSSADTTTPTITTSADTTTPTITTSADTITPTITTSADTTTPTITTSADITTPTITTLADTTTPSPAPTTLTTDLHNEPRSTATTTTTVPNVVPLDREHSMINIQLTVKFNKTFSESLLSPNSQMFNATAQRYTALLTTVYRGVTNFDKVVIIRFWPGSIGIDYQVKLKAFSQDQPVVVKEVSKQLADTKQRLLDLDSVDTDFVNNTFTQNLDKSMHVLNEFSQDVCKSEHICPDDTHVCNSTSQVCDHKCFNFRCPVNAQCYVTDQHIPMCRCSDGVDCSSAGYTSGLTTTHIVAICAGVGGAVVVIIIIITLFVCLKRRKLSKQAYNHSAIFDDVIQYKLTEKLPRFSTAGWSTYSPAHDVRTETSADPYRFKIPRPRLVHDDQPEAFMLSSYHRPSTEVRFKL